MLTESAAAGSGLLVRPIADATVRAHLGLISRSETVSPAAAAMLAALKVAMRS